MLAYLRAENAYYEAAMAPHQPLIETVFQEMRGRIPEDDSSVPVRDGDWLYWWAFQPGAQYRDLVPPPARRRRRRRLIFDEAAEAAGKEYFRLGAHRRSAPTAATPRPWSTTTARSASSCASAISPPAATSRP